MLDGACIDPVYTASVPSGSLQGVLSVQPERIQAVDLDRISAPIRYAFTSGQPSTYADFFEIDNQTGVLKQIKIVDTTVAKRFDIVVRAQEVSEAKRFTNAKLSITVKPVDANPPAIVASNIVGYVDENSPVGTVVVDEHGAPIELHVTDADLSADDPKPLYLFELTTPSFVIASGGVLTVNEADLDRDPPSPGQFRFQVVAREATNNAASAPLSLTVILRDVNDNAPKLPMVTPLSIPAGDGRRFVTRVQATDNDEGENAEVQYSIYHVSNNGGSRFTINSRTGEIETRGKMSAGEQYSITVQATDSGGLYSQAIVEVSVSPGPNTKPPRFERPVYEVQVSEGAEINSTVAVVKAIDPEDDPVRYSITSGNDLRQFAVGQESGVISVIRMLDREDLTRYQLIIRAEDAGGLASSATVNLKVTDINDKNPEFDETDVPYVFSVAEGKVDAPVGMVHATDADEGINAEITYSLPGDVPFRIDGRSGEIRTKAALDYETQQEYRFVVTAKDGAPDARLGTASVTVQVLDEPDEVPRFAEPLIEVRVPENVADYLVTTVRAHDPDTVKEVTYTLRRGDTDLFRVDAATGQVRTAHSLDYEKERRHELVIGTLENTGSEAGDIVRVVVAVEDRNDVAPVFVSVPEPVTIGDDQPIGTIVSSMPAVDGDGTAPGNVVRYELVGRGKALKYFQVDPDTGVVRLRDELHKETDTEYQVNVRAFDMGDPQLSSVVTLPVYVRKLLTDVSGSDTAVTGPDRTTSPMYGNEMTPMGGMGIKNPDMVGMAFSDDSYTVSVPETANINSTIKQLQIINSKMATRSQAAGFRCDIIAGNVDGLFRIGVEEHACALMLAGPLDFENRSEHSIRVQLTSSRYLVNPQKSVAAVTVIVLDANDNAPEFVLKPVKHGRPNTFYAVVPADAEIDSTVLQIRATDRDSGKFGTIRYRIFDENSNNVSADVASSSTYFTIAEDSGMLRTQKNLNEHLTGGPFVFLVEASDMPDDVSGQSLSSVARIVVNTITDDNRLSLVLGDSTPTDVRSHSAELADLLAEHTDGFVANIERFSNHKFLLANGTIGETPNATDVWFYVIDPATEHILKHNASEVRDQILEPSAQAAITVGASSIAHGTALGIFAPVRAVEPVHRVIAAIAINDDVYSYTMIAIAVIILVLGSVGIVYICVSWSKYKNFKQRMRQYSAPASPTRYDPVVMGASGASGLNGGVATATSGSDGGPINFKEYETQVLAMAVPNDDGDDLQLDFSAKNHAFSLDNVSYITHKENGKCGRGVYGCDRKSDIFCLTHTRLGQSSPTNSDATTAVVTTLRRNNVTGANNNHSVNNLTHNNNRHQNTFNRTLEMNRNNANPLASQGTLPGTLTLGRLKTSGSSGGDHRNNNHGYVYI